MGWMFRSREVGDVFGFCWAISGKFLRSLLGQAWGNLEASSGHLAAILGSLGGICLFIFGPYNSNMLIFGPSWGFWGRSYGVLGGSWGDLEAWLGSFGRSWGPLGATFDPSWTSGTNLGASWGPLWGFLGASWGLAGPSWAVLKASWSRQGPPWSHLG